MRLARAQIVVVWGALLVFAVEAEGQERSRLVDSSLAHPVRLSSVTGLRELRDGRVIVTDGIEERITVLDFERGTQLDLGRRGQGPGEFASVGRIFAIGGDSSIVDDLSARRWLVLDGTRISRTIPAHDPLIAASSALIEGSDEGGHLLSRRLRIPRLGTTTIGEQDSLPLLLLDRASGTSRVLTLMRRRPMVLTVRALGPAGEVREGSTRATSALAAEEAATLLQDGTLMLARLGPFRVDVRTPDGAWLYGKPLPVSPVRLDSRERAALATRVGATAAASATPPDFIPPFIYGNLDLLPVGNVGLLIRRTRSADLSGNHYLVITRQGYLVGQLDLPSHERIVSVGTKALYTASRDGDGLETLRRHEFPPIIRSLR